MSKLVKNVTKKNIHSSTGKIEPGCTDIVSDEDFEALSKADLIVETDEVVTEVETEDEGETDRRSLKLLRKLLRNRGKKK